MFVFFFCGAQYQYRYHCPVVWDLCIHFIYIELFQDTKVGVGLFRCQMTHCLQYM